ncbi:hypothetical protein F9L16_17620 [Agarivorans sp. B2Z047]|uniref:hypothetical protein n=1 Tax=Agarivorans sp. B2Z047 TaxID=2652721 RepID=UPI00128DA401|nr:hypothetical protein [Agarivorans sp. B2Z047]MPW30808.1 hypothetical protein [Agarivorans sp. B2Z047]UQN40962.1 hypothetical protein LQZ07_14390 [Agarivorans sp. B2Z047]
MNKKCLSLGFLAALFTSGSALANQPTAGFQWAGVVPEYSAGDSWFIKNVGGVGFNDGLVTFSVDESGSVKLVSSSVISFDVVSVDEEVPADSYDYELSSFYMAVDGGLLQPVNEDDDGVAVEINGNKMAVGEDPASHSGISSVTLVAQGSEFSGSPGSEVVLQPTILITNPAGAPTPDAL